jgi:Tol biopolymer transport system component
MRKNKRPVWYVGRADGSGFVPVGESLNIAGGATFSPYGGLLAGGTDAAGKPGLFLIPADGSAPTPVISDDALNPVWSEEADLIIYTGVAVTKSLRQLYAIRPSRQTVPIPKIEVDDPQAGRFLPDGTGFIYRVTKDFWHLDLSTSNPTQKPRRLTQIASAGAVGSFDVTPDGKYIVFDRFLRHSDIHLIDLKPKRSPSRRWL